MCWCWPSVSLIHGTGEWDGACGSWILKRATARCSCGDGGRHDTDETSNYLPNGRQIQGGREGGGQRDEEGGRQPEGQMMAGKGTKGRCNLHFSLQVSIIGQMKVFGQHVCHLGLKVTSRVTLQWSHTDAVAELHPGELTCWPLTCGPELSPDFVWSHKIEKPDWAGSV